MKSSAPMSGAEAAGRCKRLVRVDVFYVKISTRGKATADIITWVIFFVFVFTSFFRNWRFTMDSFNAVH